MSNDNHIYDMQTTINQRLKLCLADILVKRAMSLKALCLELNISYSHLSQIQRGAKRLTIDIAQVLCIECNVNLNYLAKGEGNMYIESLESRLVRLETKLFPKTFDQN